MSRNYHDLKILPNFFMDIESGKKTFEVRFDDRGYRVYDILHLREWYPHPLPGGTYTGREMKKEVIYLLKDPEYCKEGFVVMGLMDI